MSTQQNENQRKAGQNNPDQRNLQNDQDQDQRRRNQRSPEEEEE
ncbi:hypothetical protein [Gillisia sp. Hel_I_29]|nr:hypothetical protein [Gillisia sp. Hel_I_29]